MYTGYRLDLGVDSNMCKVKDLRKPKISHLTLMVDLENEGQTHLCMTFRISGCKHHTDMIFVSIPTILRLRMSKMSAFVIRTCFTLLYIVQLFLTFADVIDEKHLNCIVRIRTFFNLLLLSILQ